MVPLNLIYDVVNLYSLYIMEAHFQSQSKKNTFKLTFYNLLFYLYLASVVYSLAFKNNIHVDYSDLSH